MIAARLAAHKSGQDPHDAPARTISMNSRSIALRLPLCALAAAALPSARAEAQADDFYAGKTITIIVSGGGAYETYGRTFARHMPKYIPGHPTMIVQQVPGAGGARAASFLYRVAPRDGTVIGGLHGAILTAPFLSPGAADFDITKFSWIGNATHDTF